MFPSVLTFHHEFAASLLQYRFNHLEGAELKARSYNNCAPGDQHNYDCVVSPAPPSLGLSPKQLKLYNKYVKNLNTSTLARQTLDFEDLNANKVGNCGYTGTMFPWESAYTGTEVCPCIAGGTCYYEQHITGDIAFAMAQYWRATKDRKWLEDSALPVFEKIAQFWASRGFLFFQFNTFTM